MLKIELDGEHSAYRPGSSLSGRIVWDMSQAPTSIVASLTWSTEGKGDDEGDSVVEQIWHPTTEKGTQAFRWELPRGPLSLEATLIRIRWSIECTTENPDEECSRPIILSPLDRPILLKAV
jgi:hypothetical protein